MLLEFIFRNLFALRDRNVKVLLGFCRFYIEEVRTFSCAHTSAKDLFLFFRRLCSRSFQICPPEVDD